MRESASKEDKTRETPLAKLYTQSSAADKGGALSVAGINMPRKSLLLLLIAVQWLLLADTAWGLSKAKQKQAVAEATKNIYKEVADRNSGASPDPLKTKTASCAANDANCYDHTNNTGTGSIRVSQTYPPPEKAPYNYAEVLHKSFIFYFQQRSGKMPQQRLAWRKESCQECVGPGGEDLSGGYYEAGGSYLKFTFPTAFTITQLSWGVVEYRDGYEKVHELREALDTIRWGTDYLLNCISGPDKIVAMFGSSEVDFGYFGPPEEHYKWTKERREGTYVTPDDPSSEIGGEMGAALAAAAVAIRPTDPAYADKLVAGAKKALAFGMKYQGTYMDSDLPGLKDHGKHYPSSNHIDELAWGNLWVYFATGEENFLQDCLKFYDKLESWSSDNYAYDWDNKAPALHILLAQIFPSEMMKYSVHAQEYFDEYLPGKKRTVFHTKKGLSWRNAWGVMRYAANNAFLSFVHAQHLYEQGDKAYSAFLFTYGQQQVNYMLGDAGRSYVVGYGKNPPNMPFHKWSHNAYIDYPTRGKSYDIQHDDFHNSKKTNKFLAYGALVGGPQSDDTFEDSRGWCCAAYNEVAIDYNAGFTGAVARLVDYYGDQKLFSDCGLDLGWEHPNATLANKPRWLDNDCYHTCCRPRRSRKAEGNFHGRSRQIHHRNSQQSGGSRKSTAGG